MKMYKAIPSSPRIEEFEVIKQTRTRVTYVDEFTDYLTGKKQQRENTENKETSYSKWFDDFDEAKKYMVEQAIKQIHSLERRIKYYHEHIEEINKIEKP